MPRARHNCGKTTETPKPRPCGPEPTLKVAKDFPDVKFESITGYKTAPNVATANARYYEGRYLAGIAAGRMTKTHVAGYVAGFPIPEVLQGINAFTLGIGIPFYPGDDDSFGDRVALMVGAEARMTPRTKFITESYFVPGESGGLVMGGLRFFGERLSADAGLGVAVGADGAGCCLPVVNFVYSFGRPR